MHAIFRSRCSDFANENMFILRAKILMHAVTRENFLSFTLDPLDNLLNISVPVMTTKSLPQNLEAPLRKISVAPSKPLLPVVTKRGRGLWTFGSF